MTTLSPAIEMDKKYTIAGTWTTIPRHGFIEREVTIVKFCQRDYYGKGEIWTYVQTVSRIDLRRPNDTEVLHGNEFGGMQTANPNTVAHYMEKVNK